MRNNKILTIDQDSSISYRKSNTDNTVDNVYETVNTLKQLYALYRHGENLFIYNTLKCLSIICTNGIEYPLCSIKGEPKFLKINTDLLKKHDGTILIAIEKSHYIGKYQWSETLETVSDVLIDEYWAAENLGDVNGYSHCLELLHNADEQDVKLPAIQYAYSLQTYIGEDRYIGYVPTRGQLTTLSWFIDMINYILYTLGYENLPMGHGQWLWTSDENSAEEAWCFCDETEYAQTEKRSHENVLPFFHKEIK